MNCPCCGEALVPGGITLTSIANPLNSRTTLQWYPEEELAKRGLRSLTRTGGKRLSAVGGLGGDGFEGWYCPRCNQVVGLFPVEPGW